MHIPGYMQYWVLVVLQWLVLPYWYWDTVHSGLVHATTGLAVCTATPASVCMTSPTTSAGGAATVSHTGPPRHCLRQQAQYIRATPIVGTAHPSPTPTYPVGSGQVAMVTSTAPGTAVDMDTFTIYYYKDE